VRPAAAAFLVRTFSEYSPDAYHSKLDDDRCALRIRFDPMRRQVVHVSDRRDGRPVALPGLLDHPLLRQLESLHGRIDNRLTRRPELLGRGPQEDKTIVRGIGVECGSDAGE
jgi:hypothetical protein